jgi:hypothetical protein
MYDGSHIGLVSRPSWLAAQCSANITHITHVSASREEPEQEEQRPPASQQQHSLVGGIIGTVKQGPKSKVHTQDRHRPKLSHPHPLVV